MTRHFYTDALAAAWMAEHHGMRFLGTTRQPIQGQFILHPVIYEKGEWVRRTDSDKSLGLKSEKLFVAPESLHLLEPMVGDIVVRNAEQYVLADVITAIGDGGNLYTASLDKMRQWIGTKTGKRIIQRNGISFMWPVIEP